jgi:hypothetical protein
MSWSMTFHTFVLHKDGKVAHLPLDFTITDDRNSICFSHHFTPILDSAWHIMDNQQISTE